MKKIILKIAALALSLSFVCSCNEGKFLEETPYSFLSPENAYVTEGDFNMALTGMYAQFRALLYKYGNHFPMYNATDVAKDGRDQKSRLGNIASWMVPSSTGVTQTYWNTLYIIISNANMVIAKVDGSSLSEDVKTRLKAEAQFWRGMSYRFLVYLYGGVPKTTEVASGPKTDYVRDTKENILKLMQSDFKAAAEGLPNITKVDDGKVSDLVAKTYYAETCMSLGDYSTAITALSEVIDDPATGLMTERFGSHKDDVPGDPFNDLFRVKNQNRKTAGNTEALWVIQMETDAVGGYQNTDAIPPFALERYACPVGYALTGPGGETAMAWSNGRSTLNACGRGVSFMANTKWWLNDLWADPNDLRNAPYNIVRECTYDLPGYKYFGRKVNDPECYSANLKSNPWRWYPYPAKVTTPGDHPAAIVDNAATVKYKKGDKYYVDGVETTLAEDLAIPVDLALKATAGGTYVDQYFLRLPEVYFLRAEAYIKQSTPDKAKAAADINVVRSRSKATPVAEGDVTIDYILDERAREMVYEEMRRITLGRLGMYLERTRKYNTWEGPQLEDHMELWPIPYSAIESNTDAVLEQNPGYKN